MFKKRVVWIPLKGVMMKETYFSPMENVTLVYENLDTMVEIPLGANSISVDLQTETITEMTVDKYGNPENFAVNLADAYCIYKAFEQFFQETKVGNQFLEDMSVKKIRDRK